MTRKKIPGRFFIGENQMDKTNAMRILEARHAVYRAHAYPAETALSGVEVAAVLGQDPAQVYKTLVTVAKSGKNYVFLIPVAEELDLKKAAAAVGEKAVSMLKSRELLPLTGYVHGGCSPVGMKKLFPTVVDDSACRLQTLIFSGGRIGLQIETSLKELAKVIPFKTAALCETTKNPDSDS